MKNTTPTLAAISLRQIKLSRRVGLAGFLALGALSASAQTWNGSVSNLWSNAANWTGGEPTSAGTVNIGVTTNNPVMLDTAGQAGILILGSTNSLSFENNTSLTINGGPINNAGAISLNSVGNSTDLILAAAGTTNLEGGGTLTLTNNNTANRIYATASGVTFWNVNNTISGAGTIGAVGTGMIINNAGTIDGNASNGLTVQTTAGGTNTGTMEATAGGKLALNLGTWNNAGGTISSTGASSQLNLSSGVTITGGNLTTTTGGALGTLTSGFTAALSGVTITGGSTYTLANNTATTFLAGTITNNGTIALNSVGNSTDIILGTTTADTVTLAGTGTVTMSNNTANRIYGATTGINFINQETIQGGGEIGLGGRTNVTNQGTIDANVPSILTLDASTVSNTGTLEASAAGILTIASATVTNTGGTILSTGAGSTVNLTGSSVTGGNLTTASGGLLQNTNSATLTGVTITTGSTFTADNNTSTILGSSTITNNGTIALNSGGNLTNLLISNTGTGTVTLAGTGTVTMSNNTANRIYGDGDTLINQQTIQGAGEIGVGSLLVLNNQGTINANVTQPLTIDATTVGNTGTLEATVGILALQNTTITNTGAGNILANGGEVTLSNATVIGGTLTTTAGGSMHNTSGSSTLNGVTITGGSTFTADNNTTTGLVGTITNNGNFAINSSGNLTDVTFSGPVTFSGSGTVTMSSNTQNRIYGTGTDLLTNNQVIQGGGQLGVGLTTLNNTNLGTVDANAAASLTINAATTNGGLLEATAGGTLLLQGTYANTGGTILSTGTGSNVTLESAAITGGNLTTSLGGAMQNAVGFNASLNGVTITTGSTFTQVNNTTLGVQGTITNNGTFAMDSVGNDTVLQLNADTTFSGTGTVTLSNNVNNRIFGGGTPTLTNNQVIQGAGQLGVGLITLNNTSLGTVDANDSQTLTVNAATTNAGTIEATAGGQLVLDNTYANSGTILSTGTGSVATLNGATITGGNLTTTSGGVMRNNTTADSTLNGVTITSGSTFSQVNNSVMFFQGTITNNGNYAMNSGGNLTDLQINSPVTLQGGGTVTLSNNTANRIYGNSTLTNVDNTIQGVGMLGVTSLTINNGGTILANVSGGTLTVNGGGTLTNTGSLQANAGSLLDVTASLTNFSAGTLTGGTYIATGTAVLNGTIQINSFGTTGGELVTNSAAIGLNGPLSNLLDSAGLNALTNGVTGFTTNTALGTFDLSSNRVFTSVGNLSNAGSVGVSGTSSDLIVGPLGAGTYTQTAGNTLLSIGGTLTAATTHVAGGTVTLNTGIIVSPTVTNDSAGTITGSGTITSANVTNAGLIQAAGPALTLSNGVTGTSGTLEANQNSKLDLSGGINNSTTGTLELVGAVFPATQLALGSNNVTVSSIYTNANFGTGNSFNNHGNVTASTGQILAAGNAALSIVGTGVTGSGAAYTLPSFGNVHVGQSSTVTYSIENSGTTGPSVTGAIQTNNGGNITDSQLSGTGVTPANFGQLAIGGGTTTPYSVTYTGTTAGPLASGQTVHVASNFDNVTGPTVTLGSGAAYNYAAATALTTPVALGNVHVGQALGTTFSISNTAPVNATYTETLQGGVVSTTPVASASGSFTGLVAGAAPSTAISASLNTSNEGALSGTVTLGFNSQAVNNSGLGTTPLANQTVTLTGAAYQLASANSLPTSVALGNVHVGQTLGTTVNVSNTAPVNATYTETLGGSVTTTGVVTTSSSPNPLTFSVASGAAAAPVALNLNTNTAGALSGSGVFALSSNAVNGSGLGTTGLATQTVNLTGAAYNLAVASLGTLTFGNVLQNSTQTRTLTVSNSALASIYSEGLDASLGSFSGPSAGLLSNTGGTITNLAAGGSDSTTLQVTLNTSSTGAVTASVSVLLSSDGATTSGLGITPLTGQSVPITGMINANAVVGSLAAASAATPNPVVLGNVRLNATSPTQALTISNTATSPAEGLNGSFSGATAGLTANGSFTSLAAGSANSTSLVVGMDTTSAGSKNGSVTVALASDGSYNSGVTTPLGSQTIPVSGAVYQPAVATLAPSTTTNLGTMRVGTVVNTGLSITNTAPATGGYTETLGATGFGTVSSGTPTVGTLAGTGSAFSGQAIGSPANTSLGVKFTASTPGSYSGSIPVNFETEAINGSGLGTASIGSSSASFTATVNAIANPVLSLTSGFTYNPTGANSGTLNFGTLTVGAGSGSVQSMLNLENLITGNADALTGTFLTSTLAGTPFAFLDGTGATFNLGDDASSVFDITFNTTSTGFYTATLDINEASHNDSQSDLALPQFDLTIEGQINAAGVAGAPDAGATWLLVGVGLAGLALVRRWTCRAV